MADASLYEKLDLFYLGREVDQSTGLTSSIPLLYKNKYLTTHAAILGMTGSGKTGLGICMLEEAAIDRLPALVIDPKGDMTNLLLTFPEMRTEDFLPWIDPVKAEQKGVSSGELAKETAAAWKDGIEAWDQDRQRITRLRQSAEISLFTPGSATGNPVSVLGSLDAPEPEALADNAIASSLVNATVSSILGLIGLEADPLTSREHILLSSIVLCHWRDRQNITLENLISSVVSPPLERIGVFPVESFYPQAKRMELAMQLNNILASPSFSSWIEGEPLSIENLLYRADGTPRVSIFSIAHLSESERMFFVTMLLSRLIGWMRRQEGSTGLRCILYMDEIFGYFPPVGNPPSKEPMLLLLKQARAYGLGIILATQNPVDLDYKGLANIGTWFIGRLQTRQDQDKVMTGITGASAALSTDRIRQLLANMRGRTFLLHSAHLDQPLLFETRWALSYLKGPVTLSEISRLVTSDQDHAHVQEEPVEAVPAMQTAGAYLSNPPLLPSTVEQRFVPPPFPAQGLEYVPWLAGSATVRFFNQTRRIDELRTVQRKIPLDEGYTVVDWERGVSNTVPMDLTSPTPPETMRFKTLPRDFSAIRTLREHEKGFADYLYHTMELPLLRVPALKLESRPGESESAFQQRIADSLRGNKEYEIERLEEQYRKRQRVLEQRLEKIGDRIDKEKGDVQARKIDTALSFGVAFLGAVFGRKPLSVTTATRSARGVRNAGRVIKEKDDVRRVEEEADRIEREIAELASELQAKIASVSARFAPDNYPVERFSVTPRRSDIFEVAVYLLWEPVFDFTGLKRGTATAR